ncbi:hypothetical protein [Paraliomyxa miuraensis]|uniref:hypothetical protein n=1 Tax=Paraliomyxa miuraensis TaxID=376150 RepID=UPI002252EBFB|nr:hypothetical protein [Paraliomyxa miuraensis]MCX4239659.1 hypothetical protein [Paraliomyxa miuraensis]
MTLAVRWGGAGVGAGMVVALATWASAGCRAARDVEPPAKEIVGACEVVLRRAVEEARDDREQPVSLVHVQGTDAACAAAAERLGGEPGVAMWTERPRARCPGRRCGPPDGNPLVVIRHEREDCFRVAELRWTGGVGRRRCVDEHGVGVVDDGVVVY